MTPPASPVQRLKVLFLGCFDPSPGMARILLALVYGMLTHLAFAAGVGTMMLAMFFGLSRSLGDLNWPLSGLANAKLILQFPFLHSALLSTGGRQF